MTGPHAELRKLRGASDSSRESEFEKCSARLPRPSDFSAQLATVAEHVAVYRATPSSMRAPAAS
jgi:hypothetical protein